MRAKERPPTYFVFKKCDRAIPVLHTGEEDNPFRSLGHPYAIAGNFNLFLNTDRNLIREYSMIDTGTRYFDEPERYANYVFMSEEIHINDFKVLPEEVSITRCFSLILSSAFIFCL